MSDKNGRQILRVEKTLFGRIKRLANTSGVEFGEAADRVLALGFGRIDAVNKFRKLHPTGKVKAPKAAKVAKRKPPAKKPPKKAKAAKKAKPAAQARA